MTDHEVDQVASGRDLRSGRWAMACTCGWSVSTPEHDLYELQDLLEVHWEQSAPRNS
jgi:hypothetical protein